MRRTIVGLALIASAFVAGAWTGRATQCVGLVRAENGVCVDARTFGGERFGLCFDAHGIVRDC
jgi:hypothetical protein